MENLDALLEDLHATKQQVLRKQSSNSQQTFDTGQTDCQAHNIITNILTMQEGSSYTADSLRRPGNENGINGSVAYQQQPHRSLQENLNLLDSMLRGLHAVYNSEDEYPVETPPYEAMNNHRWECSTEVPTRGTATLAGDQAGIPEDLSAETRHAAEHASRQLDELMLSLRQLRMQNQSAVVDQPPSPAPPTVPSLSPSSLRAPFSQRPIDLLGPPEPEVGHPDLLVPGPDPSIRLPGKDIDDECRMPGRRTQNDSSPEASSFNGRVGQSTHVEAAQKQPGGTNTYRGAACFQCGQPVIGKVIQALGGVWHPEHFTCACCRTSLIHEDFFEHDSEPYCTECHLSLFAPKCAYCGEAIVDRCLEAMGVFWHPDHFFCQSCHIPFTDSTTAHEQSGKVYCQSCFSNNFGARCGGCQQPITGDYITVSDSPWHEQCFRCHECSRNLSGRSFFTKEGLLYCEAHQNNFTSPICASCSQPISGRCINAMGKRFHLQHFVCTYCLRQLNTGTFKERASKPYCSSCFRQLFG
ncbi:Transforming growth factor beta-1-induced transcript 1 protein [Sparganum proliferum]